MVIFTLIVFADNVRGLESHILANDLFLFSVSVLMMFQDDYIMVRDLPLRNVLRGAQVNVRLVLRQEEGKRYNSTR